MGRYFLGLSIGGDTTPVDTYPDGASLYGLLDMAGNVHEWTRSLYISYPYRLGDVREDLEAAGARVLRGGSFINTAEGVRCASRVKVNQGWDWNFGFRVAMTPG
jgi:iron(II)-dependent oxidoreductase